MAGVVLENVSRVYPGGVTAVDSINLEVADREFLVLVGPSGCGKSTTLRMIAGLEEVSSGEIRIGGRPVGSLAPKDRDIAMVFQNYALYPHMSAYKNMAFGLELRLGGSLPARLLRRIVRPADLARRRREIDEKVRSAARTLGIEHLLERLPRQLSGGERQRVAVGRAIVRRPAVFLFDEPLSNLDAKLRSEMRRELKEIHRRLAATMIYVTHDQVEALTLGERVAVMNDGAIQQIGRSRDVYDRPRNRFVAEFLGTPPMNFLEGELIQVGETWQFRGAGLVMDVSEARLPGARRNVTLGIRPENIAVGGGVSDGKSGPGDVSATVTMVELLGDASVVELSLDSARRGEGGDSADATKILSKIDARADVRLGQRVGVTLDRSRVHWFDCATGYNLVDEPRDNV